MISHIRTYILLAFLAISTSACDVKQDTRADTNPLRKIREEAKEKGIDFRAVGQEPGWLVEIDDGKSMNILADYGDKKVIIPSPTREENKEMGTISYSGKTESHTAKLVIKNQVCHDSMSGFEFETTVTLVLDSTTYQGCGDKL